MLTVALLYVAVLLLAPLAGIAVAALKGGPGRRSVDTFSQPDVRHAFC